MHAEHAIGRLLTSKLHPRVPGDGGRYLATSACHSCIAALVSQRTLMVLSHWRIFTDTKKPEAARRLIAKLKTRVDRTFGEINVDDYHKGGHVVTFDIEHEFNDWIAAVYDVISCAQQMGHGWSISGFIDEELDLIATGTSISGIKMVSCFCPRPGTPNAK